MPDPQTSDMRSVRFLEEKEPEH